jgi:hypothetical protein
VNVAGNASAATSYTFTYDSESSTPHVALATDSGSSTSDTITNVATLSISGTEAGATVQYSNDGSSWTLSPPAVAQGANNIYVRQIDLAGNTSAATHYTFTYDTIAPSATGVALSNDSGLSNTDNITNVGLLTMSGTEASAIVEYSQDGSHWSPISPALAEGSNTIYVRQIDAAGNISHATGLTFTYITQVPDINVSAPVVDGNNVTIQGSFDKAIKQGDSLVAHMAGDTFNIPLVNGTNTWNMQTAITQSGRYNLLLEFSDIAGNTKSENVPMDLMAANSNTEIMTNPATVSGEASKASTQASTANITLQSATPSLVPKYNYLSSWSWRNTTGSSTFAPIVEGLSNTVNNLLQNENSTYQNSLSNLTSYNNNTDKDNSDGLAVNDIAHGTSTNSIQNNMDMVSTSNKQQNNASTSDSDNNADKDAKTAFNNKVKSLINDFGIDD